MTQQGKIILYNNSWILEEYPMLMVDQTDIELQILDIDLKKEFDESFEVYKYYNENTIPINYDSIWKHGFLKAIELIKEKKFSIQDVYKIFKARQNRGSDIANAVRKNEALIDTFSIEDIIELLNPSTYIVIYETELIKPDEGENAVTMFEPFYSPILENGMLKVEIQKS